MTACEAKEAALDVEVAGQGARVAALEGRVRTLGDGLRDEVGAASEAEVETVPKNECEAWHGW